MFCDLCPGRRHYLQYTRQLANLLVALNGDTISLFQDQTNILEEKAWNQGQQPVPLFANRAKKGPSRIIPPKHLHLWSSSPLSLTPLTTVSPMCPFPWGLRGFQALYSLLSPKKSFKNTFQSTKYLEHIPRGFHTIFSGNKSITMNSLTCLFTLCLLCNKSRAGPMCFHQREDRF